MKQQRHKFTQKQIIILLIICLALIIIVPGTLFLVTSNDSKTNSMPTTQTVPKKYRTALKVAKNYSDVMHMSKQAIIAQLTNDTDEKFSQKSIEYAVTNLHTDYSKNALRKAKEYSDSQNMSKQAIYDQLISKNKFTTKQAQYAVDNLKADYNQNALITAKAYQKDLGFSPATIRQVLISDKNEKFTPEQADYAIQHLND